MNEDNRSILSALEAARLHMDPYPHFLIERLAPFELFSELAATWPSASLFPVPSERSLASPRRRHAWLNDRAGISNIGGAWSEITRFLTSAEFREAMLNLLLKTNSQIYPNVFCTARLCEEMLPYRLEKHCDRPDKILSLIWYIDGGPKGDLGTTLYGNQSKKVGSTANSALFLPNTEFSIHGGNWEEPKNYLRKSIHIFLVKNLL